MTHDDYLREVKFALRDLPWKQRRDLLADLRDHLAELPPETDLVARLGTAGNYTAELRAAAGLSQRRGAIAFIRSFRPRNLVLAAAVLTVLGLVIAGIAWVDSCQPLAFGNGSMDTPGSKTDVGDDGEHVAFRQGGPFEVGVSVVNYGRFTVRVLGITGDYGHSFSELPLSSPHLTVAGPIANDGGFSGPFRPFRPFDLKPGQLMLLELRGTYDARCRPAARGTQYFWGFTGFQVRYGFLWRTGTAEVDLPAHLSINGPKDESCSLVKR